MDRLVEDCFHRVWSSDWRTTVPPCVIKWTVSVVDQGREEKTYNSLHELSFHLLTFLMFIGHSWLTVLKPSFLTWTHKCPWARHRIPSSSRVSFCDGVRRPEKLAGPFQKEVRLGNTIKNFIHYAGVIHYAAANALLHFMFLSGFVRIV